MTWIYEPKDGERINIAVLHPKFQPNYPESPVKGRVSFVVDPPNLSSPSIQISDVRMSDEGRYICEYATYPRGNEQGIVYLVMLGRFPTPCWVASDWEGDRGENISVKHCSRLHVCVCWLKRERLSLVPGRDNVLVPVSSV